MAVPVAMLVGDHLARADRHEEVGKALRAATGNEWAAVCFFYAAYHLVRATLLGDSIFDDFPRLKALNRNLVPEDRTTQTHHGRRSPTSTTWGVNELVRLMYNPIYPQYEYLHQASIQVRYDQGLRYPLDRVQASFATIRTTVDEGLSA